MAGFTAQPTFGIPLEYAMNICGIVVTALVGICAVYHMSIGYIALVVERLT